MSSAGTFGSRMRGTSLLMEVPGGAAVSADEGVMVRFGREPAGPEPAGNAPTQSIQILRGGNVDDSMSRVVGQLWFDTYWWLHNPADPDNPNRADLSVIGSTGARLVLGPGAVTTLFGAGAIRFETPRADYALRFRVDGSYLAVPEPDVDPSTSGTMKPYLRPRERDFLVTFAEPELYRGPSTPRPTLKDVAARWGVHRATVQEAVTNARERARFDGYLDLGDFDNDLLERFVKYLVRVRLLTRADWDWAWPEDGSGPRPATPARRGGEVGEELDGTDP
jgi:hypothetical protein